MLIPKSLDWIALFSEAPVCDADPIPNKPLDLSGAMRSKVTRLHVYNLVAKYRASTRKNIALTTCKFVWTGIYTENADVLTGVHEAAPRWNGSWILLLAKHVGDARLVMDSVIAGKRTEPHDSVLFHCGRFPRQQGLQVSSFSRVKAAHWIPDCSYIFCVLGFVYVAS